MCDKTYVWHDTSSLIRSFMRVAWFIHMRCMPHSYVSIKNVICFHQKCVWLLRLCVLIKYVFIKNVCVLIHDVFIKKVICVHLKWVWLLQLCPHQICLHQKFCGYSCVFVKDVFIKNTFDVIICVCQQSAHLIKNVCIKKKFVLIKNVFISKMSCVRIKMWLATWTMSSSNISSSNMSPSKMVLTTVYLNVFVKDVFINSQRCLHQQSLHQKCFCVV